VRSDWSSREQQRHATRLGDPDLRDLLHQPRDGVPLRNAHEQHARDLPIDDDGVAERSRTAVDHERASDVTLAVEHRRQHGVGTARGLRDGNERADRPPVVEAEPAIYILYKLITST
jgi:hypothetical protein